MLKEIINKKFKKGTSEEGFIAETNEVELINLDETSNWDALEVEESLEEETHLEYVEMEEEILEEDHLEYIEMEEDQTEYTEYIEESQEHFMERVHSFFSNMSIADKVIGATGIIVLVAAITVGGLFFAKSNSSESVSTLARVGEQLGTVGIIGEEKLLALADVKKAMIDASEVVELKEYSELEDEKNVEVSLHLTSVLKDLKIKFINSKTSKLVGNIAFEVEITDANKKVYTKIDEDKDGIIYLTDLEPGKFKVTLKEKTDVEGYVIKEKTDTVTVKEDIEFKQIDVTDEIKKESDVDVSVEDKNAIKDNNADSETKNTDTVEWVASSRTEITGEGGTYIEVSKSNITDPSTTSSSFSVLTRQLLATAETPVTTTEPETTQPQTTEQQTTEQQTTEPPVETPVVVEATSISILSSLQIKVGNTSTFTATFVPENTTNKTLTWVSSNPAVATIDAGGKLTAIATGTVTITATTSNSKVATGTVTVVSDVEEKVAFDKSSLSMIVGATSTLVATKTPATSSSTMTYTSSDASIVSVTDQGNGKVELKAIKAGTATITVTSNGKTATCSVTVTTQPSANTTTPLKDKDGNQLYYKDASGAYIEAKVADYYTYTVFYKKSENKVYKYTGWQTIDGKTYYYDKNGNYVTGEQVIQGVKYTFSSDGSQVILSSTGTLGIDVSKWNAKINWTAVKNSGISYVIIRCGYRGYTTGAMIEDPTFKTNIQGAIAAGLKVGVYFFSQAVNEVEAVEEASMTISLIKNYKISYPVFLDVETSGGRGDHIDSATRTKVVNAYCQTIQNAGYVAGVYANKSWLETKMNASALSGYKIWLAQYNTQVTYKGKYDMWQYSHTGKVDGISGNVDMNLSYLGY
ncbi:MAG: GH25 family lysozyme [Lachnospiraceae bacterium]